MTAQGVRITLFRRLSGLYRLQAETRKRFRDRRDLDRLSLPPGVSDDESYRKIKEMIPELNSYKASTVRHLREKAAAAGCRDLEEYRLFLLEHAEELEKRIRNRGDTDMLERALFLKRELEAMPENRGHLYNNTGKSPEDMIREIVPEQYLVGEESADET